MSDSSRKRLGDIQAGECFNRFNGTPYVWMVCYWSGRYPDEGCSLCVRLSDGHTQWLDNSEFVNQQKRPYYY